MRKATPSKSLQGARRACRSAKAPPKAENGEGAAQTSDAALLAQRKAAYMYDAARETYKV